MNSANDPSINSSVMFGQLSFIRSRVLSNGIKAEKSFGLAAGCFLFSVFLFEKLVGRGLFSVFPSELSVLPPPV